MDRTETVEAAERISNESRRIRRRLEKQNEQYGWQVLLFLVESACSKVIYGGDDV
jgi:hypothetical protein